jgi:hypothetical protein
MLVTGIQSLLFERHLKSFFIHFVLVRIEQRKSGRYMNMDLYPAIIHEGDLSPSYSGSDINVICNEIHAACKGFGTDEKYVFFDALFTSRFCVTVIYDASSFCFSLMSCKETH